MKQSSFKNDAKPPAIEEESKSGKVAEAVKQESPEEDRIEEAKSIKSHSVVSELTDNSQVSNTSGVSSNNCVYSNHRGYRWAVKQSAQYNRSKFFSEPMSLFGRDFTI